MVSSSSGGWAGDSSRATYPLFDLLVFSSYEAANTCWLAAAAATAPVGCSIYLPAAAMHGSSVSADHGSSSALQQQACAAAALGAAGPVGSS
jgi:hypothetical protein